MQTETLTGKAEEQGYISPLVLPDLFALLSKDSEFKFEERYGKRSYFCQQNPTLEAELWKTIYPTRDPQEAPDSWHFPLYLEVGPFVDGEETLGVGFSNSLPVEITWDFNSNQFLAVQKRWSDHSGQNWIQYGLAHGISLLSEDPWVGRIDRRVLQEMDGSDRKTIESLHYMRGRFIALTHYPTQDVVIQLLYHLDIHGGTNSARYLAARALGEHGRLLNEKYNHYLFYPDQTEEISVPGTGKFEFVASMPISRLLRNTFFPKEFYQRDPANNLSESYSHGQRLNFWEINYVEGKNL